MSSDTQYDWVGKMNVSLRLLWLVVFLVACMGCNEAEKQRKEAEIQRNIEKERRITELTARLDLARQKSDLDQMFLCLRELQSLEAAHTNPLAEFSRVEKAIPILQKIKLAKADHNHEESVNQAADFLELFPNHPEARQALKESGLIFSYLADALRSVEDSFVKTEAGTISFVVVSASENSSEVGLEPDVARVLHNLNRADESVNKAVLLDSQFEPALRVKKAINDCRNTLGLWLCVSILPPTEDSANSYIGIYNEAARLHNEGQKLLVDRSAGSDFWNSRVKALQNATDAFTKSFAPAERHMKESDRLARMLGDLKISEVAELSSVAKELNLKLHRLADGVGSFGGTKDGERKVDQSVSDLKELIAKFKQSVPNRSNLASSLAGFASLTAEIALFKSPEKTRKALEKHKNLIAA